MISKNRFYVFVALAIILIINTQLLYPLQVSIGLIELSWITIGTLAAIFGYYVALKSNYAPFQTFVMRLIFWGFVFTLFMSILRRTFEFLNNGIVYLGLLNTALYFLIVILITLEGRSLYYSYGRGKVMKTKNEYDDSIKKIEPQKVSTSKFNSNSNSSPKKDMKVSKPQGRIDNLTLIEGIGPVIEKVLKENRISTFKQISQTPAYKIKEILDANGLQQHSPKTWPKQAELAHNNKWDELRKWQDELMGGREN